MPRKGQVANDDDNISATTTPLEKIKIEMTMEQAEELLNRPESNRTIILPSGQKVCITESGDPNGTPAIMMSGLSMHSRKYALLLNNYGLKYHVKIIGFDRPNIDGSDPIYFKEKKVKKSSNKFKKILKRKSSKSSEASSHYSDITLTSSGNENIHTVTPTEIHETLDRDYENASEITDRNIMEIPQHDNHEIIEEKIHPPPPHHKNENEKEEEKGEIKPLPLESNNYHGTLKKEEEEEEKEDDSTPQLKKGEVDLRVYAEWVEAIIDTLGIERCHLLSLCIGGLYVMGCAKYFKHPEKIASPLYLIAPWAKPQKCVLSIRIVDKFIPTPVIHAAMHCYFRTIGLMVPNAKTNPNAIMFRLIHVDEKADPLGGRRLLFSKVLKSGYFRSETKKICHDDWELGFRVNPNNKLDFSTINKDVIIYHGTKDKLIPDKSSRYLVEKWNPNFKAELHLKMGKDHSTIKGSCLHDIFKSLAEHSLVNTKTNIDTTTTTSSTN